MGSVNVTSHGCTSCSSSLHARCAVGICALLSICMEALLRRWAADRPRRGLAEAWSAQRHLSSQKPNSWLQHVQEHRRQYPGLSYKEALREASKNYTRTAPARRPGTRETFAKLQLPALALFQRAWQHRRRVAVQDGSQAFRYGDMLRHAVRVREDLSAALNASTARRDGSPRVAFLCPPEYQYCAIQWGIWASHAVCVPLFPGHPRSEWQHILQDSDPAVVVVPADVDAGVSAALQEVTEAQGRQFLCLVPLPQSGQGTVASEVGSKAKSRRREAQRQEEEAALLIYTSGTTGKPKGVVHTHRSLEAQMRMLVNAWGWTARDHILSVLPLHHIHGIVNVLLCAAWSGAKVSFLPTMRSHFDPAAVWQAFQLLNLSLFMAVPTIYAKLITQYDQATPAQQQDMKRSCKKFRLMVCGSAALPERFRRRWQELSGHVLLERYGMTEFGMALSHPLHGERKGGWVGQPLPGVEVRIATEESGQGQTTSSEKMGDSGKHALTAVGELLVRGPNLFKEYWRNPAATAKEFSADGWFHTGDVAATDGQGNYQIVGRASVDIIKSGGYKISALEIERELLEHAMVGEVAVVGVPNELYGETVGAVIAPKADTVELELSALREWCKARMAAYKVPRKVVLVESLPKNALGKVNKKQLAGLFVDDQPEAA